MIKKILAVVLALVLTMLVFASCGKKAEMVDLYGYDKPVAYDENGYAVFNSEGLVRIYRTNSSGKIMKDENGNPKYEYYPVGDSFVHDGIIDTMNYAFKMPDGWEVNDNSEFVKRGTNGNCTASIMFVQDISDDFTFNDFVNQNIAISEETADKIKENGYDVTEETEMFLLGKYQCPAYAAAYLIKDSEGTVVNYASSVYYLRNAKIYHVAYVCTNGVGYDESFDFLSYVKENYVIR